MSGAIAPEALSSLVAAGWSLANDEKAITKTFRFRNFEQAFAFMTKVAAVAEGMDHHPEWFNVYGRVDVLLTTHSQSGLTSLDADLGAKMDELAGPE